MLIDLLMPRMGESIMECTVIGWLKQPGDRIEADESVMEVATDKVDTEVLAPEAGVLAECLVNAGDVVAVGAVVGRLQVGVATPVGIDSVVIPSLSVVSVNGTVPHGEIIEPSEDAAEVARQFESELASLSNLTVMVLPTALAAEPVTEKTTFSGRFYSPLVLTIAREEGIDRAELDRIPGSGADQRVTKTDMLAYVKTRSQRSEPAILPTPAPVSASAPAPAPVVNRSLNGQTDIIQMDRMRKMIAQRMVESVRTAPHVTSFVEADMTAVVQWRSRIKAEFLRQTSENLTYTPILIEAVVRAIKDFPMINVSVEGDNILVKKQINIGMAVALPSGNLIVPVIHQADQYSLVGLTKKVNDLTQRARDNKLTADDLAGGTYTVSNIGTFGNVMGTPIIVQPQVAIMAFGAIQKKPAVIETPLGDTLGIRQLMFLSHSYDHRVVDGSLGGRFVRRVADYLEQFDLNRTI